MCARARMFAADISDCCFNKKKYILKHMTDTWHCGKSLPLTGFAGVNLSTGLHYLVGTHALTHTHIFKGGCSRISLLIAQGIPQQTTASHVT